ncbi:MAG: hypothetical protein COA90_08805, partial [Gammaproteobacteria bacterium]
MKYIITFLLNCSILFIIQANIIRDTIVVNNNISICESDTLIVSVVNLGAASNSHTVNIKLPAGYNFIGHDNSLSTPTNIGNNTYSFNIINLNIGINAFKIYSEVGCQATISGKYYTEILSPSQSSVYLDSSSLVSIFRPNILITGIANTNSLNSTTYANGAPINLSQLRTGDIYVRK